MSTALLVIDVQQSLVDSGIWNVERILMHLNKLIEAARVAHAPVILVRDTRIKPNGSFHSSLDIGTDDIEIEKSFCDSFMETELDEVLRSKAISKLVVGGLQSDFCVDTTAVKPLHLVTTLCLSPTLAVHSIMSI